jgi:hypothetical protein
MATGSAGALVGVGVATSATGAVAAAGGGRALSGALAGDSTAGLVGASAGSCAETASGLAQIKQTPNNVCRHVKFMNADLITKPPASTGPLQTSPIRRRRSVQFGGVETRLELWQSCGANVAPLENRPCFTA